MVAACPDCRSRVLRRRRREGLSLYIASLLGQWPYRCEECGSNFLLRKRYLRPVISDQPDEEPVRQTRRNILTAPIGGVARFDEVNLARQSDSKADPFEPRPGEVYLKAICAEHGALSMSYTTDLIELETAVNTGQHNDLPYIEGHITPNYSEHVH